MRLSDFDYDLPAELIAQYPARPRDAARMLVLDASTGAIDDRIFRDLPDVLRPTDTLVLNDTRVIRARMRGRLERGGGSSRPIEVFFAEPTAGAWRVLCRPGRRIRPGDRVLFPGGARGVFQEGSTDEGLRVLSIESSGESSREVAAWLQEHGETPLPPYIARETQTVPREDDADYQTVFANAPGAVAAPTAGLHFTAETLSAIRARGVRIVYLTLHVGIGTFLPVRTADPRDHVLRPERFELSEAAAENLESARREGRRIVAVGTTVTRTLEFVLQRHGAFKPDSGETDLFILPGYPFQAVDALVTNFHLPRSTLLMLVTAFAGREAILRAYQHAVALRYRFYSYGDCMMILR